MKTLKYRSAFAGLLVATLSVFLFTACEKESDGPTQGASIDRLSKFERLTFTSGSSSTSTSSTSSGTFAGGGGSISFASGGSDNSFDLTESNSFSDTDSDIMFTDPLDQGPVFGIGSGSGSFSFGSGTFSVDGEQFDLELVLCVEADLFGFVPDEDSSGNPLPTDVQVMIGIDYDGIGEVNSIADLDNVQGAPEHLVYAVQYGDGSNIGTSENFNIGDVSNALFVFIIPFDQDEPAGSWLWLESATTTDLENGSIVGMVSNGSESFDFELDVDCGN